MKKVFLDANVVLDYLNIESKDHLVAKTCLQIVRTFFGKPVVSPFTFLITNYIAGKFIKDKKWHRRQMQILFSGFDVTSFNSTDLTAIFDSRFLDLEDAIQYQCALYEDARLIVTKDVHDYFPSEIPVIHPHDFVNRYNNLLT